MTQNGNFNKYYLRLFICFILQLFKKNMSTENIERNRFHETVNSSEINDYIEKNLDSFSTAKSNEGFWNLHNKNNPSDDSDQIKTVFGVCFTFVVLLILGTYSCLF